MSQITETVLRSSASTTPRKLSSAFKEFCSTVLQMHTIANKLGSTFRVFSDTGDIKLLKLGESEFASIVNRLKIYKDIFTMASEQKEIFNTVQEKQLLWFALRSLRLAPPAEFFNILQNDHIVEVYMGTRQVYRTFNYYSLCSYSLDELETTPWDDLFYRKDPTMVDKIFGDVKVALEENRIVYSEIPPHEVYERASALMHEFLYKLEFVAPLKDLDNNAKDCWIAVLSAKLVNAPSEEDRRKRQEEYEAKKFAEMTFIEGNVRPLFVNEQNSVE